MPDRPGPFDRLVVEVERADPPSAATVVIHGEIDLATAPTLQQRLEGLLRDGVENLVVDLSDVPFCDMAALRVLLRAQSQLSSRGGGLTVLGPCRPLQLMVATLALTHRLHVMAGHPGEGTDQDEAETA